MAPIMWAHIQIAIYVLIVAVGPVVLVIVATRTLTIWASLELPGVVLPCQPALGVLLSPAPRSMDRAGQEHIQTVLLVTTVRALDARLVTLALDLRKARTAAREQGAVAVALRKHAVLFMGPTTEVHILTAMSLHTLRGLQLTPPFRELLPSEIAYRQPMEPGMLVPE